MVGFGFLCRLSCFFFFQAEDGIRDAQESRGLGDVYKRQQLLGVLRLVVYTVEHAVLKRDEVTRRVFQVARASCLLYTSDAADDLLCVDLGGRRITTQKNTQLRTQLSTIRHTP